MKEGRQECKEGRNERKKGRKKDRGKGTNTGKEGR